MKAMSYSAEESSPIISHPIDSCCICEEEFSSDGELTNHLINHTNEEEFKAELLELEKRSPVKRPVQNNSYRPSNSRKEQPLKRTASQRSSTPEVWEIISDDSDDESNKNSKSAKLSNSFRLVSTPNKPENSNVPVQKATAKKPLKIAPSYKCHSCSSEFKDMKLLQEHMLTHEKEKSFTCHICKKSFLHKASLRQHLHMHISGKNYKCKICNKKFTVKSVLRKHELEHQMAGLTQTKKNVLRNHRQKNAG